MLSSYPQMDTDESVAKEHGGSRPYSSRFNQVLSQINMLTKNLSQQSHQAI